MTLVANFNSSVTVPFQRMRSLLLESGGGLQEGIVGANDAKVAQRGAGANQTVDVPAGAMWIALDTGTRNGVGHVYNDAVANVTVSASNATNPRVDQLVCRWNDSSIPTGSGNVPTFEVVTGTATAGATLDNRTGAAALPNDCLRLADILVPATSTSVTTANIRDRRPWARGARWTVERSSADLAGLTSVNWTAIDGVNLFGRLELSGAPLRITLGMSAQASVAGTLLVAYSVDSDLLGATTTTTRTLLASIAVNQIANVSRSWYPTVAAGSHTLTPIFRVSSGTWTLFSSATNGGIQFTVEELVGPNTNNS